MDEYLDYILDALYGPRETKTYTQRRTPVETAYPETPAPYTPRPAPANGDYRDQSPATGSGVYPYLPHPENDVPSGEFIRYMGSQR